MSVNFLARSCKSEMMDTPFISTDLLYQNLHELDLLNRTLGGHTTTLTGIKKLVTNKNKTYHIIDLGCGSGDALKRIAVWARSHAYNVKLTGIDINADAIAYLNNHCKDYPEINGVVSDWHDFLKNENSIDIVHCSLFCHHLSDRDLVALFGMMKSAATIGFIINDLRRHWFAYYSVFFLTRLLHGSELSKNDGPLSILRGFKSSELIGFIQNAQIKYYSIKRKWAFRFLIIGSTTNE